MAALHLHLFLFSHSRPPTTAFRLLATHSSGNVNCYSFQYAGLTKRRTFVYWLGITHIRAWPNDIGLVEDRETLTAESSYPSWPARFFTQEASGQHALQQAQTAFELPTAVGLVSVVILVLLNGFFVATEFALVAVRRSRIEQLVAEGRRSAGVVKKALEHLDTYIAATQLGITMASLALGWLGEPALAHLIEPLLAALLPGEWVVAGSHAVAVAVSFAIITALHIVLGELAPKGIALQRPEATALAVAIPITIFLRVFRPFIMFLNGIGNLVLRLFGFRTGGGEEHVHTVEELRYLLRSSREAGVLESSEEEMVGRALSL